MKRYLKNKKIQSVAVILFILLSVYVFSIIHKKPEVGSPEYKVTEEERGSDKKPDSEVPIVTSPTTPATETKPVDRIADDFEIAKDREKIYREYPWYLKLPVKTDEYFISWILEEKSFRIYLAISESNSTKEQKDALLNRALEAIQELTGSSYKRYPYYVIYTRE
ncbi:MAG TPA: hypothetical protein PLX95_01430 [bacterium]|nr:hypothetical protein [bacterium]